MLTYLCQHLYVVFERLSVQHIVELVQMLHPPEADKVVVCLLLRDTIEPCELGNDCNGKS